MVQGAEQGRIQDLNLGGVKRLRPRERVWGSWGGSSQPLQSHQLEGLGNS